MKFFENLFDPFADANGSPPTTLIAFGKWLFAGAEKAVVMMGVVSILIGLAEVAAAWAVGVIIDRITTHGREVFLEGFIWPLLGIVGFMLVLRPALILFQAGLNSLTFGPGLSVLGLFRTHKYTLGQSLDFFEDDFAGRINQKQMQTTAALGELLMELLNAVSFAGAMILGGAAVMFSSDWRLSVVMLGWLGLYIFALRWGLPKIRKLGKERAETRSAISGSFVDSIANITTVKLFAHSDRETDEARKALLRFREAAMRFGRQVFKFRVVIAVLAGLLPVALVGTSVSLWLTGDSQTGAIVTAGILASRLGAMTGWFSFMLMGLFADIGTAEDGIATLAKPYQLTDRLGAKPPVDFSGEIRFDNVNFHYGREGGGGLNGFNLTIKPGEKVALVGRSGAGKSTVLSLLLRMRDVESGAISLDGQDIRALTQDGLRQQIGMVTQDTQMFNRSVRDNILYGRPDASDADLLAACEQAQAKEFIDEMVDSKGRAGLDAFLGERGVKLSGGQRQRIALARVILKNAPILALDEATSALDSEVEAAIQDTLDGLMEGKTVVAIAHRLSTIAQMDRIIVLDQGKVFEHGTHDELLAKRGLYAGLWQRQSGGFIGVVAAQ
ncbi:multidrug ABC transporter ATP-binding protein [Rhodobacterales bacterium 52_120_T64]|nr:multidrug ABC transporter ATP-binding protein [Rhodobacterales bacterium 52_120_T64]